MVSSTDLQSQDAIHWAPGIDYDTATMVSTEGVVMAVDYTSSPVEALSIRIRLMQEGLEGRIIITANDPFEVMTPRELRSSARKEIDAVYSSFQAQKHCELVGKRLKAFISQIKGTNNIVGFKRDY